MGTALPRALGRRSHLVIRASGWEEAHTLPSVPDVSMRPWGQDVGSGVLSRVPARLDTLGHIHPLARIGPGAPQGMPQQATPGAHGEAPILGPVHVDGPMPFGSFEQKGNDSEEQW